MLCFSCLFVLIYDIGIKFDMLCFNQVSTSKRMVSHNSQVHPDFTLFLTHLQSRVPISDLLNVYLLGDGESRVSSLMWLLGVGGVSISCPGGLIKVCESKSCTGDDWKEQIKCVMFLKRKKWACPFKIHTPSLKVFYKDDESVKTIHNLIKYAKDLDPMHISTEEVADAISKLNTKESCWSWRLDCRTYPSRQRDFNTIPDGPLQLHPWLLRSYHLLLKKGWWFQYQSRAKMPVSLTTTMYWAALSPQETCVNFFYTAPFWILCGWHVYMWIVSLCRNRGGLYRGQKRVKFQIL